MDNFYLFLASDDSPLTHVNNTAGDFVVELPRRYRLDVSWKCTISEITFRIRTVDRPHIRLRGSDQRFLRESNHPTRFTFY
jgi:hypothetical protein